MKFIKFYVFHKFRVPVGSESKNNGESSQSLPSDESADIGDVPNSPLSHTSFHNQENGLSHVTSNVLDLLNDDAILDGLDNLPPGEEVLGSNGFKCETNCIGYNLEENQVCKPIKTTSDSYNSSYGHYINSPNGSFPVTHIEGDYISSPSYSIDSNDISNIPDSHYFELHFARREAENHVEQLKLQLKSKTMQLEQVQVALMSYEEEIMNLRKNLSEDNQKDISRQNNGTLSISKANKAVEDGAVSLETAEALSSKIIHLQQQVEELEESMVHCKLDNAQLRENNEFLKATVKKYMQINEKKGGATVRKLFSRS